MTELVGWGNRRDPDAPRRSVVLATIAQGRPANNVRNLLVFLGPLMTGTLGDPGVAPYCLALLVPWVLVSAATYAFNDVSDYEDDLAAVAANPEDERSRRPLMRGELGIDQARWIGRVEAVAGVAISALFGPVVFAMVAGYFALNLVRSHGVNRQPPWIRRSTVPDVAIVSIGFVLRVASPAHGLDSEAPVWGIYLAVFAGAMVVSAGKRLAKLQGAPGEEAEADRRRLVGMLRFSAAATCATFPIAGYLISSEPWQAVVIFASTCAYSASVYLYAQCPRRNPFDVFQLKVRRPGGVARREWGVVLSGAAAAVLFCGAIYLV